VWPSRRSFKRVSQSSTVFEFTVREKLEDRRVSIPLLWLAENLYPATGAYRSNQMLDCARWEGFVKAVREDGTTYNIFTVYGWTKMSELTRPGELEWNEDGEITNPAQDIKSARGARV